MSFSSYTETKAIGIPWLGTAPSHWGVSTVKHVAPFQVGWTPPTGNDANFEGENLWANISDLGERTISDTAKRISDFAAKTASMSITPKGSLLFSFKLSVGTVSFAGIDLYTNEAIASFLPSDSVSLGFLYYAAPLFIVENAATNIYGAKILNQELIRNAPLLVPPFDEQTQIARFLDFETAKIDRLIDKQRQLIALLKEKRQAVISHAVTKGLNPDAPMKDSGVEWLGEVPAHWRSAHLKFFVNVQGGYAFKSELLGDEGTPVIRIGDIPKNGRIEVYGCKRVPTNLTSNLNAFHVASGDILMAMTGATLGKAGRVPKGAVALLNQRVGAFRVQRKELRHEFLWHVLATEAYQKHVWLTAEGGAQPNIGDKGMLDYRVALPPLKEQDEIVVYLARRLPALDALNRKASDQIELLQERRTALISAAVTGKIDVRDWTPPQAADAQEVA